MKNNTVIITVVLAVLVLGGAFFYSTRKNAPAADVSATDGKTVLYFGDTCPHCKIVEEFIQQNKVEEKVQFERKEVYRVKANANELTARAEFCKLDTKNIGVPFLWAEGKCFVGQNEVIGWFKSKAGIN